MRAIPLPGEQALAAEHAVSRMTVRRALAELEREGLIDPAPGAGTFVTPAPCRQARRSPIFPTCSPTSSAMGRTTDVRLLAFGYREPPAGDRRRPSTLPPGERVQHSVRVRMIDGKPFSYLTTHVPERIGITYSEAGARFAAACWRCWSVPGVTVARATQEISAVLASPRSRGRSMSRSARR